MNLLNDVMKAKGDFWAVRLAMMVKAANEGTTVFKPYETGNDNIVINKKGDILTISDIGMTDGVNVDFILIVSKIMYRRYLKNKLYKDLHERGNTLISDNFGRFVNVDIVGAKWNLTVMIDGKITKYKDLEEFEEILHEVANEKASSKFKHALILKLIINGIYNGNEFTDKLFPSWYKVKGYSQIGEVFEDFYEYSPWQDKISVKGKKYRRYELSDQLESYIGGSIDHTPFSDDDINEMFDRVTSTIDVDSDELKAMYVDFINIARNEIKNSLLGQENLIKYHKCEISRSRLLTLNVSNIRQVESFDNKEKDGNDK